MSNRKLSRRTFIKLAGTTAAAAAIPGLTPFAAQAAKNSPVLRSSLAKATDPITFTLYSDRSWWFQWKGGAYDRITTKTGVSFNVSSPAQDDSTGRDVSLMIASNSLPDVLILDSGNTIIPELISGGLLYSLDELIDQYTPKLRTILNEQWGPEILTLFKQADGKTYGLTQGYQTQKYIDEATKNAGLAPLWLPVLVVNRAYYKEIGSPDVTTPEGLMSALEKMFKNHPDKIAVLGDKGQNSADLNWFSPMFGVEPYYVSGDKVQWNRRSPKWLAMIKFAQQLAAKGLFTQESFTLPGDVVGQKVNAGDAITAMQNSFNYISDPTVSMIPLDVFKTYQYSMIPGGWMTTLIPKTNRSPERIAQFLQYAADKAGQIDFFFGLSGDKFGDLVNGLHFFYDPKVPNDYFEKGKPTLFKEFSAALSKDWSGTQKTSGLYERDMYAMNAAIANLRGWDPSDPAKVAYNKAFAPRIKFWPEFRFTIDPQSDAGITKQRISDLSTQAVAQMVFADASAVDGMYAALIKQAEDAGLPKLEAEWTTQYKANLKALGR